MALKPEEQKNEASHEKMSKILTKTSFCSSNRVYAAADNELEVQEPFDFEFAALPGLSQEENQAEMQE